MKDHPEVNPCLRLLMFPVQEHHPALPSLLSIVIILRATTAFFLFLDSVTFANNCC